MSKNLLIILILSSLIIVSCIQENEKPFKSDKSEEISVLDTSVIAILHYDNSLNWVFENSKPTILKSSEITLIDSVINSCIANYNSEKLELISMMINDHPEIKIDSTNFLIDIKDYKRQYLPVENEKGERLVWVNLFCGDFKKNTWNKVLIVKDGGKCYFSLKINLQTGRYYEFMVNGQS